MFEAGDAAFLLLLGLSLWKVLEVLVMLPARLRPVRPRKPADAAELAVRHLRTVEWLHTREGRKIHLRGCQHLKESEDVTKKYNSATNLRAASMRSRHACCAPSAP